MYYNGEEYLTTKEVEQRYGMDRQVLGFRRRNGEVTTYRNLSSDRRLLWFKRSEIEALMRPVVSA